MNDVAWLLGSLTGFLLAFLWVAGKLTLFFSSVLGPCLVSRWMWNKGWIGRGDRT